MTNLVISNAVINQTEDGLYSLNDLHKASGGLDKDQPAMFMRNSKTKDLAKEIHSANMQTAFKTVNGGSNRGTYVCKELVYAYAMWISPAFNLKVIRAFDSMQSQGDSFTLSTDEYMATMETMTRALGLLEKLAGKVIYDNEKDFPVKPQNTLKHDKFYKVTDIGKALNDNMTPHKTNALIVDKGFQIESEDKRMRYQPTEKGKKYCMTVGYTLYWSGNIVEELLK